MSKNLIHIQSLLFDNVLAIATHKYIDILRAIGPRIDIEIPEGNAETLTDTREGIAIPDEINSAVIRVHGTLVNRGAWIGARSGLTSYEGLRLQVRQAANDDNVDAVIFDIDCFGGEAAGMADLADEIAAIEKPTYAVVDSHALSGAYWIAAACDQIYCTRDSLLGSIGVIAGHRDETKHNEQEGYNWSIFTYGMRKADFSPHLKLAGEAAEWMQKNITETGDAFTGFVAQGRGLTFEQVKGFEAAIFRGKAAVSNGLADGIATADVAIDLIMEDIMKTNQKGSQVTAKVPGNNASADGQVNSEQQDESGASDTGENSAQLTPEIKQMLADAEAKGKADAQAAANKDAREQASQRVTAITADCQRVGRMDLAADLVASELTVDQARGKLFDQMASGTDGIDNSHDNPDGEADPTHAAANYILNAGRPQAASR